MSGLTGDRIFHNNTVGVQVEPRYLSLTIEQYHGGCWWFPLKDAWNAKRPEIERAMWRHVGVKYDYPGLLLNLIGEVNADERLLYCSEDAFICYGGTGKVPSPGKLPSLGIFKEPVRIK
jgi:hypothetical protein